MKPLYKSESLLWVIALAAIALVALTFFREPSQVEGSVTVSNEYVATSTGTQASFPNYRNALRTDFRPGYATNTPGVLGSIVITAPGVSEFYVYDATSTATNAENLDGTTTLAHFAASAAAGTYTFDVRVKHGVLIEYMSAPTVGSWASTTITKR